MNIEEHYAEAEKALGRAKHLLEGYPGPTNRDEARTWALIGQVHATLATVTP